MAAAEASHSIEYPEPDGTKETDERIKRVFTTDPGLGVVRHADAGYKESIEVIKNSDLHAPMIK